MKLSTDDAASAWLGDLEPDPDSFDWDAGNLVKNMKHGVDADEIESIFYGNKFVFAGKIMEPAFAEWRGLVLGHSGSGRRLALIFTRRGEKIRAISCRAMRPPERRLYEASIKESS